MGETTNGKDIGATDADASNPALSSGAGKSASAAKQEQPSDIDSVPILKERDTTPTQPPQNGIEEAHILEERIVAPPSEAAPLPVSAAPAAPAPAPVPALGLARVITDVPKPGYIQSILGKIKLPERRASAAPEKPAQVYDTSLTAKPEAEKEAAQVQAAQAARAITEKMASPDTQADVRALHTLKDDLQYVVRDKKISLVRAVALEEEKRHRGSAIDEHLEVQAQKQKRTRYGLFAAGALFFVGLLAVGAVLYVMAERTQKNAAPITAQVLFSEQSVPLPVDNLAPADIRREIGNARTSASLTLGAILQIVPIVQIGVGSEATQAPISFGTFLEKIGAHAPPELPRALTNEFFLGLHTVDENAPLIIIPVTSYERAFAAMLEWEKNMNSDLAPMFTPVSMQKMGVDGLPTVRTFEDTVMRNYDVRALKDESGQIQLYYSFPTRNVLIIAESPYSFSEILSRLRADRKL